MCYELPAKEDYRISCLLVYTLLIIKKIEHLAYVYCCVDSKKLSCVVPVIILATLLQLSLNNGGVQPT